MVSSSAGLAGFTAEAVLLEIFHSCCLAFFFALLWVFRLCIPYWLGGFIIAIGVIIGVSFSFFFFFLSVRNLFLHHTPSVLLLPVICCSTCHCRLCIFSLIFPFPQQQDGGGSLFHYLHWLEGVVMGRRINFSLPLFLHMDNTKENRGFPSHTHLFLFFGWGKGFLMNETQMGI